MASSFNHTVNGDFTNNGTFSASSSTFTFSGSSRATIGGSSATTFNNITVDKGLVGPDDQRELVQGSNLTVNGTLNVLSGMHNQVEAYTLTAGTITIASGAKLRNFGTGCLTLGAGGLANSGTVDLNGGGDIACGSGTKIQILFHGQRDPAFLDRVRVLQPGGPERQGPGRHGHAHRLRLHQLGEQRGQLDHQWRLRGGPHGRAPADFRAAVYREGVQVTWRTGYEADNLGFHLYREEGGRLIRLTPELVAGSALFAGTNLSAGRSYTWWDDAERRTPNAQRLLPHAQRRTPNAELKYWLEDVDLNGKRTRHGPITAAVAEGPLPGKAHSAFISRLGLMKQQSQAGDQRSTVDKTRAALRLGKSVVVTNGLTTSGGAAGPGRRPGHQDRGPGRGLGPDQPGGAAGRRDEPAGRSPKPCSSMKKAGSCRSR